MSVAQLLVDCLVPLQIIEVYLIQSTVWMLHHSIQDEDQFKIEDLMAVWWKNHIIWNTTIPQDQKFSTVIVITKLPGPYSS